MHQETYRGVVKPPTRGVVAIAAGFALLLAAGGLQAATCSISTTPNPPTINVGQSVAFTGSVTGKSPLTYTWAFAGGTPASATAKSETVSYASAGSFAATLNGKNGRNETCTANVTVQVNTVGNRPPVAQNDEYNTQQNTQLVVTAPGVLGNDNDPDGNPITTVLGTTVTHGTLSLNSNGGFTYTPANNFNGSDSFTYRARDSLAATSNLATVTIGVAAAAQVSINSTSADGALPTTAVQEQSKVGIDPTNAYTLLAINDLGMHCGDQDTRISSILPPFNVLHAQVVQRGRTGLPRVLGEGEVTLSYSAASNPNDPAIAKVASGQALSSVVNGEVYKTNFWNVAFQAYDPFYPPGVLAAFYDPNNPANNVDIGLPVPDVERLYLGDGQLHATQQAMPGLNNPYILNEAQMFQEHFTDFPFFINFPFGYVADNVNWFEAAGVPIAMFDDFGRENPYPLVRVQAKQGTTPIASLDTVMPISGEAECQTCHAATGDGGNGSAITHLTTINSSIDDPLEGSVPTTASVEWASDLNILRLHDQKHATSLLSTFDGATGRAAEPVVCQRCHYTPALDLAQVGPNEVNGRDQVKHKSMSNVMHSHHASTGLFPTMPPAIDAPGQPPQPGNDPKHPGADLLHVPPRQSHPVHARGHGQRWPGLPGLPRSDGPGGQRLLPRCLSVQSRGLPSGRGLL